MKVPFRPRFERAATGLLLAALGGCCLAIAWSTAELEAANDRRRAQLRLLGELAQNPSQSPPGPVAGLDGLYERRIHVVRTYHGPVLRFEPAAEVAR